VTQSWRRSVLYRLLLGCIGMNWFALAPPVRLHAQANNQPATNGPDPTDVLRRARVRLLADAARMPRYTCEQQIVRHFYRT
jgi:hypothetical protein